MTCISFGERAFHGWTRHPILCPLSSSLYGSFRSSWWGREADDRRRPYFGRFATVATGIRLCVCSSRRRMRKNCCFCLLVCGPGIAKPSFRVNSNVSSSGLMVLVTCTCASTVCVCVLHHISRTTPNEPTSPVAVKKRAVFHPGTNRGKSHTQEQKEFKKLNGQPCE